MTRTSLGSSRRADAGVVRRRWASQDPSSRSRRCVGFGPAGSVRTRHSKSAPVPIALRHNVYEKKPRSASTSIPGVSRSTSDWVRVDSDWV